MKIVYNKLVRDHIPEIIRADGQNPQIRIMEKSEYRIELLKKLVEEALETEATGGNPDELVKEIGDLEEVVSAIIKEFGLARSRIDAMREKRRQSRGGFGKRIFLEYAE